MKQSLIDIAGKYWNGNKSLRIVWLKEDLDLDWTGCTKTMAFVIFIPVSLDCY